MLARTPDDIGLLIRDQRLKLGRIDLDQVIDRARGKKR
jgi:hypothetical protein